jgi:hypothetical protein
MDESKRSSQSRHAPTNTQLVRRGSGMSMPKQWDDGPEGIKFITSLNLDTAEGREKAFACKNDECMDGRDFINTVFEVTDFFLHGASRINDETGEEENWTRCVLVLATGDLVQFGSQGIVDSLDDIISMYRHAPWNPPIKLQLKSKSLGGGRTWYNLRVAK